MTPEAALERALQSKIDVLCVTDHDTIDGAVRTKSIPCQKVQIVVGCEFTAEDGSHIIGLNLRDMFATRSILGILDNIKLQGGLVLLPHLFRRGSGIFRNEMRRSEDFMRLVLSRTDIVECHNGRDNWEHNQRSNRLAVSLGLPAVAGSDAHTSATLGSVFVEYDKGEVRHGISPRRIFFPPQAPTAENPAKRRVLELFHRHRKSLPPVVDATYRTLRAWLKPDSRHESTAPPQAQYEFGAVSEDASPGKG
jgi:predicted metal-dependent phosphoesterase TrpH